MFDLTDCPEPERLYVREFKFRSPKEFDKVMKELEGQVKVLKSQGSTIGKVRAKFQPMAKQLQPDVAEINALMAEAMAKMDFAEGFLGSKAEQLKVNLNEGETAHRTLSDNYHALVEMFDNLREAHAKAEKSGAAGDWDEAELAAKA